MTRSYAYSVAINVKHVGNKAKIHFLGTLKQDFCKALNFNIVFWDYLMIFGYFKIKCEFWLYFYESEYIL